MNIIKVNIERKILAIIKTKIVSKQIKQRQMLKFKNNTAEHIPIMYLKKVRVNTIHNKYQVNREIKQYLFIYSKGVIINDQTSCNIKIK